MGKEKQVVLSRKFYAIMGVMMLVTLCIIWSLVYITWNDHSEECNELCQTSDPLMPTNWTIEYYISGSSTAISIRVTQDYQTQQALILTATVAATP